MSGSATVIAAFSNSEIACRDGLLAAPERAEDDPAPGEALPPLFEGGADDRGQIADFFGDEEIMFHEPLDAGRGRAGE